MNTEITKVVTTERIVRERHAKTVEERRAAQREAMKAAESYGIQALLRDGWVFQYSESGWTATRRTMP